MTIIMKFQELDSELRAGKLRSVYVFHGPERFLMSTAMHLIQKLVLGSSGDEDRFDASQTPVATVIDTLKTPSMFAKQRLIIVDGGQEWEKEAWAELGRACADISSAVLMITAEKIGVAVARWESKTIAVVECKTPYPRELPSWIQMEARRLGVTIAQQAALILAESVGSDLGALSQSLEKLSLYSGDKKLIDAADVEAVVAQTASRTVFDMTNAIGSRKPFVAMALVDNLITQGEAPVKILPMITRHFRLLAKTQEAIGKGMSETDLAKLLKVHPFFVKEYVVQAKQFRPKDWPGRFAALYACDRSLKSSRLPAERIFEKTILKLCA